LTALFILIPLQVTALQLAAPEAVAQETDAATLVQQRARALERLIPLKKMTVGPDDQYQGVITPDGAKLIFTRKSDLVPHLCVQDQKTGMAEPFLSLTADSQEASLNGSDRVAFVYFRKSAAGDICHRPLDSKYGEDNDIECIDTTEGERASPFWRSSTELGFLVRNPKSENNKVLVHNIKSKARSTLAEGSVWSPFMHPGGKMLVANEAILEAGKEERVLSIRPVSSEEKAGTPKFIRVDLPGTSGFPVLSKNEAFIYFSHYLNDTNQDGRIDGNDNSVLFRLRIDQIPEKGRVFPEQLTLAESNCSYPRISGDRLIATCASGGTLDLFELPSTGVVPAYWDAAKIWNAHQTSRSYAERILLLNSLRYRFPSQISGHSIQERLLSDHMLAGDSAAARFYAQELQWQAKGGQATLYHLTDLLLAAQELKGLQENDDVTREFAEKIGKIDAEVARVREHPAYRDIIRGTLAFLIRNPAQAETFLRKVKLPVRGVHPLVRQIGFELGELVFAAPARTRDLVQHLAEMIQVPDLSQEARIYTTVRLLTLISERNSVTRDRIPKIDEWIGKLPSEADTILRFEKMALQLTLAADPAAKMKTWRDADAILSKNRENYFLKRALLARSIVIFDQAGDFDFVNIVAANWLRYTGIHDTEYAPAQEIVSQSQLDRAYEALGQKKPDLASKFFYGSLSLTDDLESHSGYIRSMIARGQRSTINERYQSLAENNFISDNRLFVDALLGLLDAAPGLESNPFDIAPLEGALAGLEKMTQDRDSDVRHLLMGYLKLVKLERTAHGYQVDRILFEEAHRHFMLALDLARDNDRVTASALMNLGILHARLQNHGQAVRFFEKRKAFGFLDALEEAHFTWLLTRSLLRSYQEQDAVQTLETFLKSTRGKSLSPTLRAPLQERLAFTQGLTGQFNLAAENYRQLLTSNSISGEENLAKARLNRGRALLKSDRMTEARDELLKALQLSGDIKTPSESTSHNRLTGFEPRRLRLLILGFLAQTGSPSQKLEALQQRIQLLKDAGSFLDEQTPTLIRTLAQAATLARNGGASQVQATQLWMEAFDQAKNYLGSQKTPDPAVIKTIGLFLADGVNYPQEHAHKDLVTVEAPIQEIHQRISKLLFPQADLDASDLEIQLLWGAYQNKSTGSGTKTVQSVWEQIRSSIAWKRLEEQLPERTKSIAALAEKLSK
jgi:hypothetical protein